MVITGGGTGLTYTPERRTTATPRRPDRHLHLHPERRLDRDRRGHRHLRRRRPGRGQRHQDGRRGLRRRPRSTCSPTTPTSTAARSRSTSVTQPRPRHGGDHRRRHRAHLHARTPNYCNTARRRADTFTYTLNGGSTATVSVTVTCVDDTPVAVDDTADGGRGLRRTAIDVLANDTDVDGGPMYDRPRSPNAAPRHGRDHRRRQRARPTRPNAELLQSRPAGSTDTFTYTLNGGSTATVSVTVTCVDDPPGRGQRPPRRSPRTPARRRSTCSPTTPTSTAARRTIDLGRRHAAAHGSGRDHRRRHRAHLHARTPTTATQPAGDPTDLHLHPERRLDGDRLGHRHLRRRPPGRGQRLTTVAEDAARQRRSTCSPTTPTSTAARRRSTAVTPAGPRHGGDHRRRHRAHLQAERQLLQLARRRDRRPSPTP